MPHNDEYGYGQAVNLDQWEGDYASAPAERDDRQAGAPDGKYQAVVERVELTKSKTSGLPMLKWSLRIISGQYQNYWLFRNNMIASADNVKWLKGDLYVCGLQLDKLGDLNRDDVRARLIGVVLEVQQKTNGEYKNVYFNRRINVAVPAAPEGAPGITDEDIPF